MVDELISGGPTPGIAAGAGAGTGPTLAITGDNSAGVITLTTGTTPTAAAVIATISFSPPFAATPRAISIDPGNAATAALTAAAAFELQSSRTATQFVLQANGTALTASTAYVWQYIVVE